MDARTSNCAPRGWGLRRARRLVDRAEAQRGIDRSRRRPAIRVAVRHVATNTQEPRNVLSPTIGPQFLDQSLGKCPRKYPM